VKREEGVTYGKNLNLKLEDWWMSHSGKKGWCAREEAHPVRKINKSLPIMGKGRGG